MELQRTEREGNRERERERVYCKRAHMVTETNGPRRRSRFPGLYSVAWSFENSPEDQNDETVLNYFLFLEHLGSAFS